MMIEFAVSYFLIFFALLCVIRKVWVLVWKKPKEIKKHFQDQGIRGPPLMPFIGSLGELAKIYGKGKGLAMRPQPPNGNHNHHDVLRLVFPHLHIWREKYGEVYLYWYGPTPRLSISDPEMIREVFNSPLKYAQVIPHPLIYNLLGKSLVTTKGETWAARRRLLSPFFFTESIKNLSGLVVRLVEKRIHKWKNLMNLSNSMEINVDKEFENLVQEIISTVIFGHDDFEDGMMIAQLQAEQSSLTSEKVKTLYVPGSRFLPTRFNRRSNWLRKEVERIFEELIEGRMQRGGPKGGDDWLGSMISSSTMSRKEIMDECRAIAVGGTESTNILLARACVILSMHTEWQDRAREEAHQVLRGVSHSQPITSVLHQFKILNMIINETLRLYPPVPIHMKKAEEDLKLGRLTIPAGTEVELPIIAVHHDPRQWGDNADEFDPGRFADGVSRASEHPTAFLPFTHGPRMCIGAGFAVMEAKITLAMVLTNFRLTLSHKYKHELVFGFTMKPGNDAYVVFHKI